MPMILCIEENTTQHIVVRLEQEGKATERIIARIHLRVLDSRWAQVQADHSDGTPINSACFLLENHSS